MKQVVQFSGGLCSFWAAHRLIQLHGSECVTLLFADTKSEDRDLYRFLNDAESALGVPITRISDGRSVWGLFKESKMLGNSRFPLCSAVLKRNVLDAWRFANTTPETHVFNIGLDWTVECGQGSAIAIASLQLSRRLASWSLEKSRDSSR